MKFALRVILAAFCAAPAAAQTPAPKSPIGIVTLGNSITLHGPSKSIGWDSKWGMAASTEAKDYSAKLSEMVSLSSKREATVARFNMSYVEKGEGSAPIDAFSAASSAQIVIVELGDNVKPPMAESFRQRYALLLRQIRPPSGILLCTSTYWPNAPISGAIKSTCQDAGGIFVDIGEIHSIPRSDASYLTEAASGVRRHPGDLGMFKIAETIHSKIIESPRFSDLLSRE